MAITLVVATNQAFKGIEPKLSMYGEPKEDKPKKDWSQTIPSVDVQAEIEKKLEEELPPPTPTQIPPSFTQSILNLQTQIKSIETSSVSGRKKVAVIEPLQFQLNHLLKLQDDLQKGDQKEY